MRRTILALAAALFAATAHADDTATLLKLNAAALKLKAAAATAAPTDLTQPITLMEAYAVTRKTHKVVLVSVGDFHCATLCVGLRPEIPTTHVKSFGGDATPHLRLFYAAKDGQVWQSGERWTTLPTEAEVRAAAQAIKDHVEGVFAPKPKAAAPNVGQCPCHNDGSPCLCQPASDCAKGLCALHNPKLSQAAAWPTAEVCRR